MFVRDAYGRINKSATLKTLEKEVDVNIKVEKEALRIIKSLLCNKQYPNNLLVQDVVESGFDLFNTEEDRMLFLHNYIDHNTGKDESHLLYLTKDLHIGLWSSLTYKEKSSLKRQYKKDNAVKSKINSLRNQGLKLIDKADKLEDDLFYY